DPARREWVEEVTRTRLADDTIAGPKRKMTPVPPGAAPVMAVEVADLLPGRTCEPGVPAQVRVERSRAGLLRPEDQEVRQRSRERGRATVRPHGIAQHGPRRARDAGNQLCGEPSSPQA